MAVHQNLEDTNMTQYLSHTRMIPLFMTLSYGLFITPIKLSLRVDRDRLISRYLVIFTRHELFVWAEINIHTVQTHMHVQCISVLCMCEI